MALYELLIGILTLVFGVLILAIPKLLRYIIGLYFVIVGGIAVLRYFI
ncbi:DUF3096 domain-containing protein [Candidatus Woesearchaeota archaeon]|nr:DUF3096 domain-containing protein [Candidatus Woesearchaeota archaeon]